MASGKPLAAAPYELEAGKYYRIAIESDGSAELAVVNVITRQGRTLQGGDVSARGAAGVTGFGCGRGVRVGSNRHAG